jgi:hypothetical protein
VDGDGTEQLAAASDGVLRREMPEVEKARPRRIVVRSE